MLVWGSERPRRQADGTDNFRLSPVFLAAVRIEHLRDSTNWRFFHRDDTSGVVTWSSKGSASTPVMFHGAVGELSVTFDDATKQWRMVYAAPLAFFPDIPESQNQAQSIVVMRTAERPEGPWSKAIPLFLPKEKGEPGWGDDARGLFYHDGNPRLAWSTSGDGSRVLAPIFGDAPNVGRWALPPGAGCASSFPSWCPPIALKQDVDDPAVGCCSRSDRCCDFAFDQIGFTGTYPHFSWSSGNIYAPYLIQPFTREIGTRDTRAPDFPTAQRLFYTLSTLNPYVVVLMSTDVDLDLDEDGVPNAVDNCPLTWNPGQQNCNEDAEASSIAKGIIVPKLGDACDPVPCPDSNTDATRIDATLGTCGTNRYTPSVCIGRLIRDGIDLTPVGAGTEERLLTQPAITPRATLPVGADTEARFCQANTDDPTADFNCDDPLKLGDRELVAWPSDKDERGDDARHLWHRISLSRRDCHVIAGELTCFHLRAEALPRGASFPLAYGTEHSSVTWRYQDDYDFWTAANPPRIPDATQKSLAEGCANVGEYGNGTCLDGRLWLHADTFLGWSADFEIAPNGTRVGHHGQELSNHYFHNAPDKPFVHVFGGLRARQLFFIKFTLPDPAAGFRYFAGRSLPLIREDGHIVAVFDDGRHENTDFIADDALRAKMLDRNLSWLSPVEASPYLGGLSRPVGIALSRDGSSIASMVLAGRDGVLQEATSGGGGSDGGVDADAGADGGEICVETSDGLVCSPALSTSRAVSASAQTPSRTGFAAVYSRAEGRVFIVGGRDAAGALLDQVGVYRVDLAQWETIPLPRALGDVVAATYSWRDGRLWVIDYDPADVARRTARLLRIEPTTRDVEVVARAVEAPAPRYDYRGLFLDLDGNVGVFASSERSQKHRIAVVREVAGGLDARMTMRRDRALSAQPIVDVRGVTLYYEPGRPPEDPTKDPDDDPVAGDRVAAASHMRELPLRAANVAQIAELLR